jgi:hypothetical protein
MAANRSYNCYTDFAFEIWMIVDAAINKEITDKAKAWWIIGMLSSIHLSQLLTFLLTIVSAKL